MSMIPVAAPAPLPARRVISDYEFLPAALEILETPLSPVRSSMILTICAIAAATLGVSYVGRIDVIASAQGKIQAVGRTKTIQPLETGRVLRLAVENGQTVQAGDLLLDLDPSEARADEGMLASDLVAFRAEIVRRRTALQVAGDRLVGAALPPIPWDRDMPADVVDRETRILREDLARLASQLASLEARRLQTKAEVSRLTGTIGAQGELVGFLKQRVDMRAELLARNAESKASVIDAEEAYGVQATALATEQGQLGEALATLPIVQGEIDKVYADFLSETAQKLGEAERHVTDDQEKLGKAKLKTAFLQLRAPIDGVVQGLTVTTTGQVVGSGEQLMQIVPAHAPIEIECYLANGDIGFVKPGQSAVVKVQSFAFTSYGTVDATVSRIAEDAIPEADADQREGNPIAAARGGTFGGAQRLQNLVFPVTLALHSTTIEADGAKRPLGTGMAVTVEIKTGSRRILDFLLSPLADVIMTAFKER